MIAKNLKGTVDYWPEQTQRWRFVEQNLITLLDRWGYQEVRTPIIESSSVFDKLGQDSDVIGKQMYRVVHPQESIVLRPEGTSSILRSGIQHHTITRNTERVWYYGPMFRHERPQKGRLRQFHQLGGEMFGFSGVSADIELLDMLMTMCQHCKITDHVTLEINSLGSSSSREQYKQALVAYLSPLRDELDEDSQRRLESNPLRILDSKHPHTQSLLSQAPLLQDYLREEERERFHCLTEALNRLGHRWVHNPRLVRGLDYYNDLVFEITTSELGAQSAICAGGRYDTMADAFGHHIPALGFSFGMERLMALVAEKLELPPRNKIIAFTQIPEAELELIALTTELRARTSHTVIMDHAPSNFNNKYTRALKEHPLFILTVEPQSWAERKLCLRRPHHPPRLCAWNADEILSLC